MSIDWDYEHSRCWFPTTKQGPPKATPPRAGGRAATKTVHVYEHDGELFPVEAVEQCSEIDRASFTAIELPASFTLTTEQITKHDGNIVEILLAAGVAKFVKADR
jgi:hypothetical protein